MPYGSSTKSSRCRGAQHWASLPPPAELFCSLHHLSMCWVLVTANSTASASLPIRVSGRKESKSDGAFSAFCWLEDSLPAGFPAMSLAGIGLSHIPGGVTGWLGLLTAIEGVDHKNTAFRGNRLGATC